MNPQIMKINVDKRKLDNLLNKYAQWKEDYTQILQQYDLKLQHNRDKQAMLNSEQVSSTFLFFRIYYDFISNEHFHNDRFYFR